MDGADLAAVILRIGAGAMVAMAVAAGCAAPPSAPPDEAPALSYAPFAALLLDHVDARGLVDYRGLKESRAGLDAFVTALGSLDGASYDAWDRETRIAFWINAYNALTLKAVIDRHPLAGNSVREIPGLWDELRLRVLGREVTLDQIEHRILRQELPEARVHMALVCAARGCPPLRWEPYDGERLDAQLEDQTVAFLARPGNLRIDREGGRVELSSIFEWYAEDFVADYGTDRKFAGRPPAERAVLNFVAGHLEGAEREYLETGRFEIEYVEYDWTLNESAGSP